MIAVMIMVAMLMSWDYGRRCGIRRVDREVIKEEYFPKKGEYETVKCRKCGASWKRRIGG